MKVTIIKGPNFEKAQEEAYKYLSKILSEKGELHIKMKKEQKNDK